MRYLRVNINHGFISTMAFLSTEEVIEALDKDEPAMGSEVDGLSLCSFEDEQHTAVSGEEE